MAKFIGQTGLVYLWGKFKNFVSNYVKITSSTGKDTITAGNNSIDVYDWAQASTKPSYTANEVGALPSDTEIPASVTEGTVSGWGFTKNTGTYSKPSGGIPKTDLTSEVQTSLGKADTALQSFTETDPTVPSWAKASSKPSYTASEVGAIATSAIGAAGGVCPLDANTKIDSQYLPSYVDDVIEAYIRTGQTALSSTWLATGSASGTTITPESGKIYVLMNSDSTYSENTEFRWGSSTYVKINDGGISEMTTAEMDTATDNWA